MAKITVIPSTINPLTRLPNCELTKRKILMSSSQVMKLK